MLICHVRCFATLGRNKNVFYSLRTSLRCADLHTSCVVLETELQKDVIVTSNFFTSGYMQFSYQLLFCTLLTANFFPSFNVRLPLIFYAFRRPPNYIITHNLIEIIMWHQVAAEERSLEALCIIRT